MQKELLREKIIDEVHRLDYYGLQKLSAFTAGLKGVKALGEGRRGYERMDIEPPMFTAKHLMVREDTGFRLTFFCEVCGDRYVTPPLVCDTPQDALHLGEQDARLHFNRCSGCQRWVCDEHFNENQMMCTDCMPRTCAHCGAGVPKDVDFCASCGAAQFEAGKNEEG